MEQFEKSIWHKENKRYYEIDFLNEVSHEVVCGNERFSLNDVLILDWEEL